MNLSDDPTRMVNPDNGDGEVLSSGQLFGKYRIERLLGRGGMGAVYAVKHEMLGTRHALKVIHRELAGRAEMIERFRREATVMARLRNAHIVQVDEFGEEDGTPWLRMELVEGTDANGSSLSEYLKSKDGKLPQTEARELLRQILEGLSVAHASGVVHRDLKPANILLSWDGDGTPHAKITDFGLVRMVGEDWLRSQVERTVAKSLTLSGQETRVSGDTSEGTSTRALLGTYAYMSPEQKRGEEADERSDLYAVGLIAYQMLTGEENLGLKAPSRINPELSLVWDGWIEKATEAKREDRVGSAGQMMSSLPGAKGKGVVSGKKDSSGLSGLFRVALWLILLSGLGYVGWWGYGEWEKREQTATAERLKLEEEARLRQSESDEIMRLREAVSTSLSAGNLADAGRLLSELESRGVNVADLRRSYENLGSAREARARAGEAEALRNRTKGLVGEDDEGLRSEVAQMESTWLAAERAFASEVWGEALSGYDRVLKSCQEIDQQWEHRKNARDLRSRLEVAYAEASQRVESVKDKGASDLLSEAHAQQTKGTEQYGKSAFAEAITAWQASLDQLPAVSKRLQEVLDWRKAESEWNQALAEVNVSLLKEHVGTAWSSLQETVGTAKASEKNPVAGARIYRESATALYKLEEEAWLSAARALKEKKDWEGVLRYTALILGRNESHREGQLLINEAADQLKPRLRIVSVLPDGQEVAATLVYGDREVKLPHTLELQNIDSFKGFILYENNDKRYRGTPVILSIDWKGVRELKVSLAEVDVPRAGQAATVDLGSGMKLDMIWVKPGTFKMGSPASERDRSNDENQFQVTLSQGYWLGKTEVTQAQWQAVMGNNPSHFRGSNLPVERVNWEEAMAFCRKLTERERAAGRLPAGYVYTLPTEAQWEYACRAGTTEAYAGSLEAMAWYGNNGGARTQPVATKQANRWGFHDMHGNVWEWCLDWYGTYPSGSATDPRGPSTGSYRVFRGGGWGVSAGYCRSALRINGSVVSRRYGLGFRVALSSVP